MNSSIGTTEKIKLNQPKLIILAGSALLIIAALLIYFMLGIYPTGDDGWYELSKMQGASSFKEALSDRYITSLIYDLTEAVSGSSKSGLVYTHTFLWLLLALETLCLSLLICESNFQMAAVAALLSLSPVIVKSNVVTITYDSATIVPVVLAYGGILLLVWNAKRDVSKNTVFAAGFLMCFLACLISEYGFCASIAGSFFLIFVGLFKVFPAHRQMLLTGIAMLGVTLISYIVFSLFFASLEAESKKNVFESLKSGQLEIFAPLVSWLSHIIFLNLGAVLREFGNLEFEADSKSTLLALGVGCVIGALIYFCAAPNQENKSNNSSKLYLSLLIAGAMSLLPFMLTGRNVFEHELNTRYLIPAMPMAIIGILVLMSMLMSGKAFRIFLLSLAFLSGSVTVTYMTKILRHEQRLAALSPELQSLAGGDGITVFVLEGEKNSAISLTGKITAQWSDELREKTWIMPEAEAFELYGTRKDCAPPETINLDHRKLTRRGVLKAIYNVDAQAKNEILIEPFCKF